MPRKKQSPKRRTASLKKEQFLPGMPPGAIKADLSKHAPHNSHGPPLWYVDQHNKCVDCNREFIFTARQQQYWFEILKIPIYVYADRCPGCRAKRRAELATQKKHMEEMAKRPRHPNEAFFRKKAK